MNRILKAVKRLLSKMIRVKEVDEILFTTMRIRGTIGQEVLLMDGYPEQGEIYRRKYDGRAAIVVVASGHYMDVKSQKGNFDPWAAGQELYLAYSPRKEPK